MKNQIIQPMLKYIYLFFIPFVYSSNVFCQSNPTLEQILADMNYKKGLPFDSIDKKLSAFLQKYIIYKSIKLDAINTNIFKFHDMVSQDTVLMGIIKYTAFNEDVKKVDDFWEYFLYSSKNLEFHKLNASKSCKIDGVKPEAKIELITIYGMDGFEKYRFHNLLIEPRNYQLTAYYIENKVVMAKDGGFSFGSMKNKHNVKINKKLSFNTLSEYLNLVKKFKKEVAKSKKIRKIYIDTNAFFLQEIQ